MGMISKFASANDSIIPRFLKLTVVEKKDENKRLALFSKERSTTLLVENQVEWNKTNLLMTSLSMGKLMRSYEYMQYEIYIR